MKLAVVGAGWAGLAAAVRAADSGHAVQVYEAGHTLGGRARSVHAAPFGRRLDNGQHLLLGAYTRSLALMRRLEVDARQSLLRQPLRLASLDGRFHLRLARLPSPWHALAGVLGARGPDLHEKWALARSLHRLRAAGWRIASGLTVQGWLDKERQSAAMQARFWHPLCLAAMNTPPHEACAQLFAHVLRDSLGGSARASNQILPRVDLTSLWPARVADMTPRHPDGRIEIHKGHAVRRLVLDAQGRPALDGEAHDGVILACGPATVRRLLDPLLAVRAHDAAAQTLAAALAAFEHRPIATLTLSLATPWALRSPMVMLREDRDRQAYGQWLFHRPRYAVTTPGDASLVHVVISDAQAALEGGRDALVRGVIAQVRDQAPAQAPLPAVQAHQLIVEKRATFAALPGLARPGVQTPWPRLWLAGDWTDTGYPAVLEGAVRSGEAAARRADQVWAAM